MASSFMRAWMGEERLSGLAMIHNHYDITIDLEQVVDIIVKLRPRKLELKTLQQYTYILTIISYLEVVVPFM